ncbi:right-handed parallel beta-helix repeat-containing protein [Streptomyces sp. NPDC102381]|uniref:right-handed parallel beta-helix repeat-containing protein n=1 Tax=Streptomyces sp. NPDC102381 TaxID=3366164 RepID=UPI003801D1E5
MSIPVEIPTIRVTATYVGPDGRPLKGTITFTGPSLLTFAESDLFIAGPVAVSLDESGRIVDADGNVGVHLPATDSPNMNPTGWAYTVKENLTGVSGARTYSMLLPAATPGGSIDLADVAPADPTTPNYVPVPGTPGAHWYWGDGAPTAGLGAVDGDLYVNRSTGDLYAFVGSAWVLKTNIKGPAGTGSGTVTKVAGVLPDSSGSVALNAANVSALPVNGATVNNVATSWKGNNTNAPLTVYGNQNDDKRFSVLASGAIYSNSLVNTVYNLGIGDTSVGFGGGSFVLGMKNRNVEPTTAYSAGLIQYSHAGALRILEADGTVTQVHDGRKHGVHHVKIYGATGNGSTDDAPSIQAALNAVKAAGGGQVVVPPGTYKLATLPLRIYKNTRLTLMPGATFVRGAAGTVLLNGDATQSLAGYTGHGNIVIEGGVWDMKGTTFKTSDMCISIGHARNVYIRDVDIRDVSGYHGIELNSTNRAWVEDCRFLGYVDNTSDASRGFSEAVQIDLSKGAGEFGGFGPYDNVACEDIVIQGCYFGASGTSGTIPWPRGVGSHSATIGRWHKRVRVQSCDFNGIGQYGISAYNYEESAFIGNNFNACGSAVRIRTVILTDPNDTMDANGNQTNASQSLRMITVSGNTMRGGGGYDDAIVCFGEDSGYVLGLAVTGNTIDTTTTNENGIRLQCVSRATVSGNVIVGTSGSGISTESCTTLAITGNEIYAPGARGITCVANTDVTVANNNIRDAGNEGILFQTTNGGQITGNYIRGASTSENAGSSAIRLSASTSQIGIVITNNVVRPGSNANKISYALSIGQCVSTARGGNDLRAIGGSYANGALSDGNSSPATSVIVADLVA